MRYMLLLLTLSACDTSVEQTPACAEWVSCIDARDAQLGVTTDNDRFIAGGDCWGNPEIGDLCDKACAAGMEQMQGMYDDLPEECQQ
jgi:hypothetical protein